MRSHRRGSFLSWVNLKCFWSDVGTWSRDPPHPSALVVVDRLADFLLRPVLASFPDSLHEVMMSDPAHAPCNRPHDSPPVPVFQGVRRNPKARQRCAHDKLIIGGFDHGKLAIDQTIPDPFNRLCQPKGDVLDHAMALKTTTPVFVVEHVLSRE